MSCRFTKCVERKKGKREIKKDMETKDVSDKIQSRERMAVNQSSLGLFLFRS